MQNEHTFDIVRTVSVAAPLTGEPLSPRGVDPRLAARIRPTSSSRDQRLAVLPALTRLLPGDGLQRGTVVAVSGAPGSGVTTLALALIAAATEAGAWAAAVALPDLGAVAAADIGIDLEHLLLIAHPGLRWAEVTAACLEGVDVVLLRPPVAVGDGVARRLASRARERRTVLVTVGGRKPWPGADIRLEVEHATWTGITRGHGHLERRRAQVVVSGRREAARRVAMSLWLPASSGVIAVE
jgi:hypothetical protein